MKSIEEENQGILKEFFIPKYLQYIKEEYRLGLHPMHPLEQLEERWSRDAQEMLWKCSGEAQKLLVIGSGDPQIGTYQELFGDYQML